MKHYYTNNDDLESAPTYFEFEYDNKKIKFKTDIGVFSKSYIDYGSKVLLDAIIIDDDKKTLLDVGCGYGGICIPLKMKYPHLSIVGCDVNHRALDLAKENIKENSLSNIEVIESDRYTNINGLYDVIVTNPPIRAGKEIVSDIVSNSINYLNDKGQLFVVVQKKQGAPSIKKNMENIFNNVEIVKRDKGYYVLKSIKN